jgi:hypothetical protein
MKNGGAGSESAPAEERAPLQRDVLREVMLSAQECDTWLTLEELAHMTSYPPASISAQLRHLRKTRHGGYRLDKRCRPTAKHLSRVEDRGVNGPVWEYQLEVRRFRTRQRRKDATSAPHAERMRASA